MCGTLTQFPISLRGVRRN